MLPEQRHDAVSPIAIAVALAVPLLLLSRLFPQFAERAFLQEAGVVTAPA